MEEVSRKVSNSIMVILDVVVIIGNADEADYTL